ncbi:PREDICTED: zinc-finger homeodomain protein 3-like [Camelina sativa]|uniref:Zinc-finger homeodomain protein 3-like n=1 Tax=Camelina sativa TaxID=90675 RepID=A0ABM1QGJ6_CAMSA|nr:PREDICTED: zinc-finger homeodomain protein 3-like [Camelina sativa]
MEIASQEDPTPINTSYGNSGGGLGNMIHNHHANSAPTSLNITTPIPLQVSSNGNGLGKNHDYSHHHHHHVGYNIMVGNNNIKKEKPVVIKYKECLKNHAASKGGNAIDGCGDFMPSGEDGSIEALTCSACNCHRNFHRREVEGEEKTFFSPYLNHHQQPPPQRKLMFHHHHHKMMKSPLPQQMIMPIGVATAGSNSESEDLMEEDGGGSLTFWQPQPPPPPYSYGHNQKKRFRTKFTQEQKEKMMSFAERVGWKMQRQEESAVQQLCQEIGIRRRVLKVWMHNNKHHLSKKSNNINDNVDQLGNKDVNNATTENLASTSPS